MDELAKMKGDGKRIAQIIDDNGDRLELVVYSDGSYGVTRGADTVGMWEPAEAGQLFCWLAGNPPDGKRPQLLVMMGQPASDGSERLNAMSN